jgi:hypothetical protein
MDYLASGVQFLKATRARFPGEKELFPFIALRSEAITLIEPSLDEEIEAPGSLGQTTPHQVVTSLDSQPPGGATQYAARSPRRSVAYLPGPQVAR